MAATDDSHNDAESSSKMSYSKPGNTLPSPFKFKCMATGAKRQDPCDGCKDTHSCMTDSLQIKEPIVDNINEKSVVKIDSDGNVKTCAKGDASQCGYKPGAKVCGKCGAMAVEVKFVPGASSEDDEEAMDFAKTKGADAEYCECDDPTGTERDANGTKTCEKCGKPFMPMSEKGAYNQGMSEVDDPMDEDFKARRKARHKKRMAEMGMKADDIEEPVDILVGPSGDEEFFLCAASREVKSIGEHSPCADCTGRCVSSDARPDLLEIEAMAQDVMGGKVLFSAYSDEFDMFAVQVRRKDGQPVEVYFTSDGEHDGWLRIPESSVYTKTAEIVDLPAAIEAALGTIEGKALAIAVGRFEDQEAYLVDVDGLDGKSYEVAVAPNGTVFGFTERAQEEKRMFSTEERDEMAEEGEALPDGSYPIANEDDLKNAIQAFGRAKDPEAAKAHIMKRAKDLGLEDMIPENWMSGEKSAATETAPEVDPAVTAALLEIEMMAIEAGLDDLLGDN